MNGKDFFPDRDEKFTLRVIAHRGASVAEPENTLAAFHAAVVAGADGVELDVRRTADATLAVHHDPDLADGRPLLGLRRADLPPSVPDLSAALDVCRGLSVVNVEIKNMPHEADFDETGQFTDQIVEALLARPADERPNLLVSSFHRPTIDRVRRIAPELRTAWLVLAVGVEGGDDLVAEAAEHGHEALHPHHLAVDESVVERARRAGVAINTWTCDEPDRMRWLAEIGVDGVITNVPDVALSVLGRGPTKTDR